MSLLLDALKKAEKAKEAAQRGDRPKAPPQESALSLEPTPDEAKRVMTRDNLPDISTPLEIGSEDISPRRATASSSKEAAPPARPAASAAGSPPSRPGRAGAGGAIGDPAAAQRAAAQSVLQAKFKEPNPRLPFYISMGVLGVFAIGTAVYFYLQLRPRPPLVNLQPKPPAGEQQVEVATAPRPIPGVPSTPASTGQAIPGLPAAPTAQPAPASTPSAAPAPAASPAALAKPPAATAKPAPAAEPAAARPTGTAQAGEARGETPSAASSARPEARARPARQFGRRSVARVNPGVAAGYAAYQAGDLEAARRSYQQALRAEPRNIDALLGLAAVELRAGQYPAADRHYQQVLRLDPRNPHANAGMLALRSQQFNPVAAESRIKSLLAGEPGAQGLQFTLGNQYAQQSRWNEAQQAYFKALASEPSNPDFAYNLAVSLDHLRQVKPALQHYRLALKLAETRSAAFDANAVRARIAQLAP
jgi:tetratricopeptide (TPR) repeat protein